MFDFSKEAIFSMLLSLPAILFCLSIHEFSHGWVANKLGDHTAQNFGRLTLNPVKHIDPFGFIALLFAGFGWAKPVPVNPRNLGKPKRDMALVGLAGPVSNLLFAFIFAFVYALAYKLCGEYVIENYVTLTPKNIEMIGYFLILVRAFVSINLGLAVFNMIPVPPLDGSRILDSVLPSKVYALYHKYEQYVSIAFIILILATDLLEWIIGPAVSFLYEAVMYIPSKVFF